MIVRHSNVLRNRQPLEHGVQNHVQQESNAMNLETIAVAQLHPPDRRTRGVDRMKVAAGVCVRKHVSTGSLPSEAQASLSAHGTLHFSWRANDSDENDNDRPPATGSPSQDERRGGGGGGFGEERRGPARE